MSYFEFGKGCSCDRKTNEPPLFPPLGSPTESVSNSPSFMLSKRSVQNTIYTIYDKILYMIPQLHSVIGKCV